MYAATAAARKRDAAIPKPKKTSPLTTVLPICCLLLVAFLTAAMIVLALIPLYLPRKDVTLSLPTFLMTIEYEGSIGPDGHLSDSARASFARAVERALTLKQGSVEITKASVVTTPNTRQRRTPFVLRHRLQRGFRDPIGIQKIYGEYQFILEKCGLLCRSPEFLRRLQPVTITVNFEYNEKKITLVVTVYFKPNPQYTVPPPFDPETPTTTAVPTDGSEGTIHTSIYVTDGESTTPTEMSTSTPAMVTLDLVP